MTPAAIRWMAMKRPWIWRLLNFFSVWLPGLSPELD